MSSLSTHVLDTSRGGPAAGVAVVLKRQDGDRWKVLARGETDDDGRLSAGLPAELEPGVYALRFEVEPYFVRRGVDAFYPHAEVVFKIVAADEHYHVPLLLSPFGYSTYRGS